MRDYDTEEIAELLERMKMGPKHPDYDNGVQKRAGEGGAQWGQPRRQKG